MHVASHEARTAVAQSGRIYNIGFVIEQALGHITHTKNLQQNVPLDPAVRAHWGLVPWETTGLAARLPVYNSNWTVRAGLRARRVVRRMMQATPLDAVFFHTQVPAVLATSWIKRVPSVVSLDATPIQYDSLGEAYGHAAGPAWLEYRKWQLNRDCFRAARRLVTWSEWAKQGVVRDYEVAPDKVIVIPPGVNPDDWAAPTPRAVHDGPVKILFVGGNFERKGGLLLLEAFRHLRSLGVELHLVTRDTLPEEPGVFVYRDVQPNSLQLKQLYHSCDIFCLPTKGDCLPMVLSEAGAAGLPAVSTQIAAIPEIIRHGETGFVVPMNDPAALTHALRELVCNPQLRLYQGQRAVNVVRNGFDAQRNALRLLDVLKDVAERASATEAR